MHIYNTYPHPICRLLSLAKPIPKVPQMQMQWNLLPNHVQRACTNLLQTSALHRPRAFIFECSGGFIVTKRMRSKTCLNHSGLHQYPKFPLRHSGCYMEQVSANYNTPKVVRPITEQSLQLPLGNPY